MAVLALTVIGTAGAFGYRAMFGGSVLPTLPPIIKAGNGPNKIVPAHGDSQANNSAQPGAANSGSAENLVSREEQPVNIEPAKAAPRVVATIPIITGEGSLPPGVGAPAAPAPRRLPIGRPESPALRLRRRLPLPRLHRCGCHAGPGSAPAAPPAQAAAEPKKIHTVTIKADQVGAPLPLARPARAAAASLQAAPRSNAAASPPPAGSNAPLSIVPGSSGRAAAAEPQPQPTPGSQPRRWRWRAPDRYPACGPRRLRAAAMPCRSRRSARRPTPRPRSGRFAPSSPISCAAASRSFAAPISAPRAPSIEPWSVRSPPRNRRRSFAAGLKPRAAAASSKEIKARALDPGAGRGLSGRDARFHNRPGRNRTLGPGTRISPRSAAVGLHPL